MQIKHLALALTVAAAAAEFIVITDHPKALETLSPQQVRHAVLFLLLLSKFVTNTISKAQSYLSSILPGIRSELLSLARDTSYIARATSVLPQLSEFAATATVRIQFPLPNPISYISQSPPCTDAANRSPSPPP